MRTATLVLVLGALRLVSCDQREGHVFPRTILQRKPTAAYISGTEKYLNGSTGTLDTRGKKAVSYKGLTDMGEWLRVHYDAVTSVYVESGGPALAPESLKTVPAGQERYHFVTIRYRGSDAKGHSARFWLAPEAVWGTVAALEVHVGPGKMLTEGLDPQGHKEYEAAARGG